MLIDHPQGRWWYMESPRTGSTTIDRSLRQLFPQARAPYQKHWPLTPGADLPELRGGKSLISIRNPYSRAVSCWQFFTKPGQCTFKEWLTARLTDGFCDIHIEARPQAFWFKLQSHWDFVIRQESLNLDFWAAVHSVDPTLGSFELRQWNSINGDWVNRVQARTHRGCPWQEFYDQQAQELVRRVYAADFEHLNAYYSQEFPALG